MNTKNKVESPSDGGYTKQYERSGHRYKRSVDGRTDKNVNDYHRITHTGGNVNGRWWWWCKELLSLGYLPLITHNSQFPPLNTVWLLWTQVHVYVFWLVLYYYQPYVVPNGIFIHPIHNAHSFAKHLSEPVSLSFIHYTQDSVKGYSSVIFSWVWDLPLTSTMAGLEWTGLNPVVFTRQL